MSTVLLLLVLASSPPDAEVGAAAWIERARRAECVSGDPPIERVQAAAAHAADPALAARGGLAAARAAALLPRVTAEVRVDDRSYRIVGLQTAGEVDYARFAPGWSAGLRATWDLAALVAPAGRITGKGLLDLSRRRDEAVRAATTLYFERCRLGLELALAPPSDPAARARSELELRRLGAELDRLTGGTFTGGGR